MPISNLPSSNSAAVIAAPSQTSRQSTSVSGSNLNMIANIAVMATNEMNEPPACSTVCGSSAPRYCPAADNPVVNNSETSNRKPMPNRRQRNQIGAGELPDAADFFSSTSQTVLKASLS